MTPDEAREWFEDVQAYDRRMDELWRARAAEIEARHHRSRTKIRWAIRISLVFGVLGAAAAVWATWGQMPWWRTAAAFTGVYTFGAAVMNYLNNKIIELWSAGAYRDRMMRVPIDQPLPEDPPEPPSFLRRVLVSLRGLRGTPMGGHIGVQAHERDPQNGLRPPQQRRHDK